MENEILSTIDIIKGKFETLLNKFDKVIAKEEIAKLIVQFIFIKNDIDCFFETYTKEDIAKCEKITYNSGRGGDVNANQICS